MIRSFSIIIFLLIRLVPLVSLAQSEAELKSIAATFPVMPKETVDLIPYVQGLPTFASGTPFSDLEYTLFSTDYMDGENSGHDVFMPVNPAKENPGSNHIKVIKCVLNTDLNENYRGADSDRIILGTAEAGKPYFLKGDDGLDNDYAVIAHFDYEFGYIQLYGDQEDYSLVYCSEDEGCNTEGWYLFYTIDAPDLIAFIYPCWDLDGGVSGNPPRDLDALCNNDSLLNLANQDHFRFAGVKSNDVAINDGLIQIGSSGKDVVSGVAIDRSYNSYLFGYTEGGLDDPFEDYSIFITKVGTNKLRQWTVEIPMTAGSIPMDAVVDNSFLYVCGRTLGNLPGFTNAGRWDGFLLKIDLSSGEMVNSDQWGNAGIDGYGNIELDNKGNLY